MVRRIIISLIYVTDITGSDPIFSRELGGGGVACKAEKLETVRYL